MRIYLLAFSTLVLLLFDVHPTLAQKRLALLIGNQNYTGEISRLGNPHNDIALLGERLSGLGFEVTSVRDAGFNALQQAINGHVRRTQAAGPGAISFLYYSGHGAQDGTTQTNYLIPIDVTEAEDERMWDRSVRLNEITRRLKEDAGQATHFVVFDACRNELKLKKSGSKAVIRTKGFAPIGQESGMLIAYATAEGELASDVGTGAGPYARVLAEEIVRPGVEAVSMFRRVQLRVKETINQSPWLTFPSLPEVYLAGAPGLQAVPPPPVATRPPTPVSPPPTAGKPAIVAPTLIAAGPRQPFTVEMGKSVELTSAGIILAVRDPDLQRNSIGVKIAGRSTRMGVGQEFPLAPYGGGRCKLALMSVAAGAAGFLLRC
jgi:hypothetical protein